jgi:transcriptional regulator with XRE-family HTH domain
MATTKAPSPIDIHVGSRLRTRRVALGMSQATLGEAFGLSFQQVQKYENGKNRMGASRLQQAADILGVTVPFFFEGGADGPFKSDGRDPSPAHIDDFVSSEDGQRLIKAFTRIARPAVRQRIVALVNEIAVEHGRGVNPPGQCPSGQQVSNHEGANVDRTTIPRRKSWPKLCSKRKSAQPKAPRPCPNTRQPSKPSAPRRSG